MNLLTLASLLLTVTALFSFINARWIKLPTTIGVMLIALAFSVSLVVLNKLGWANIADTAASILSGIDFNITLMQGMLSFLLFAGALHVNLNDLREQRWVIGTLASIGVVISTFLVGTLTYYLLHALGINISYLYCLMFGALISPTDPIAVLSILKSIGAPKPLETKITGESLFNDGVGVVVFLALLGIAQHPDEATVSHVALLFAEEAIGGAVFGLALGYLGYTMLRSIDNYQVEVLITLAMVMGGYALASALHFSGPIAVVVAGLLIGNEGRKNAMSDTTIEHLDTFWELLDEILNALLFVLIGLEVLVLQFTQSWLLAGLIAIPIVLFSRWVAVGIPISLFRLRRSFSTYTIRILVWGGLRGGISVALALSLPAGSERDLLLAMTYVIVVFSIVVQGLSIEKLIKRTM